MDVISHSKSDPKPQSSIWATCTRMVGSPKLTLNLTHPHSKKLKCFKQADETQAKSYDLPKLCQYLRSKPKACKCTQCEVKTTRSNYCFMSERFISQSSQDSNTNSLGLIRRHGEVLRKLRASSKLHGGNRRRQRYTAWRSPFPVDTDHPRESKSAFEWNRRGYVICSFKNLEAFQRHYYWWEINWNFISFTWKLYQSQDINFAMNV